MDDGHLILYLNPNRNGTGKQWLWSYHEPQGGLDPNRVRLLWGDLRLTSDKYREQVKSAQDGYRIRDKIAEREEHGYLLLPTLPGADFAVVRALIAAWQMSLYEKQRALVDPALLAVAKEGLRVLGGQAKLVATRSAPLSRRVRLFPKGSGMQSRYNW